MRKVISAASATIGFGMGYVIAYLNNNDPLMYINGAGTFGFLVVLIITLWNFDKEEFE